MARSIDYGNLMHRALRGVISEVLADVARKGLPGAHHFFITFAMKYPGVKVADWMRERYPDEMTIVLQNWFADLKVGPDGFGVTLNFSEVPEPMFIPFDAIRTFADPSVEFGLKFEPQETRDGVTDPVGEPDAPPRGDGQVVSLDSWRK